MYDAASPCDVGALQRASGELRVAFRRRGELTVLDDLRQVGCLKARFPRVGADEWTTAVMLNTSGGVAAGDRLDAAFDVRAGARATLTAQAAERFYRAVPGGDAAVVRTRIDVASDAAAEWLPQETLLFDQCALDRQLTVELAESSWFLGVESLVFGRKAMGECVAQGRVRDVFELRRDGRLVMRDAVRLDGPVAETLQRRAIGAGAAAMATVWLAAPDAESAVSAVRATLDGDGGIEAGASAWNGLLVTRILAGTSAALRLVVMRVLSVMRASRPLPRVWAC